MQSSRFVERALLYLYLNIPKTKIMVPSPITIMANRWGKTGNSDRFFFGGDFKITTDGSCSTKSKDSCFLEEKL